MIVDSGSDEGFPMGESHDISNETIGTREDSRIGAPSEDTQKLTGAPQDRPQGPWWKDFETREIEYTANGKAVKEPLAKVLQRAQTGYNYAQSMADFNRQREEFDNSRKSFEADADWKQIVDYARQDPEWAAHTREAFQNRQNWRQQNANDPFLGELNKLRAEIEPMKQAAQAWKSEAERAKLEKEDHALEQEVKAVTEKYSKLGMDFSSVDPSTGLSMESTVVDYAVKNGIKSFKTAFLEVYGDKLETMREEALKAQWAKDQATKAKQGFIGRTPTPQLARRQLENPRSTSWDQAKDEALADYKAGLY